MEWKLFKDSSEYITAEWYEDRDAAHHLEQPGHRERLLAAHQFVLDAIEMGAETVVDLGCAFG